MRSLLTSDLTWSGKAAYLAARSSASRWKSGIKSGRRHIVRWKSGASVVLRSGTSDAFVFREIFLENVYQRALAALALTGSGLRVLDCGANIGLFPVLCASCFDRPSTVCIEPDSGNIETLSANVALSGGDIRSVRAFVGARDGQGYLHDTGEGEWAFKLSETPTPGAEAIPVLDIPSLLRSAGWDGIDLLKMDIEGAESDVFADCVKWIDLVRSIIVELHGAYSIERFMEHISGGGRKWKIVDALPDKGVYAVTRV